MRRSNSKKLVSLSKVNLRLPEVIEVNKVLRSGNLAQGIKVKQFENLFSNYVEGLHCVAVNSGTSALQLALMSLDIGFDDEVIVPSFSFAATANAVKLVGAVPVFCDIDPNTLCIDVKHARQLITKKTKCIIPVHLFGLPADMIRIYELASEFKLKVIDDAAQAHGSKINGEPIGWMSDASIYSFYPTKNVTSGEGGMICFKNQEHADLARVFRNQGMKERYVHTHIGMNYRMSDIHAAIGIHQIDRINRIAEIRRRNAKFYLEKLNEVYKFQGIPSFFYHVYHQFVVLVNNRDALKQHLLEYGVESAIYYPIPIHKQRPYRSSIKLPVTEEIAKRILAIPIRETLSKRDLKYVAKVMNSAIEKGKI